MVDDLDPAAIEDLMNPLLEDMERCTQSLGLVYGKTTDVPFWRRALVRAFASNVEGACFVWRQVAIRLICSDNSRQIPVTKLALLQDKEFRVQKNGKLKEDRQRQASIGYIAFTFRTCAELLTIPSDEIDRWFSDDGWRRFQDAIDVRDRLTHPKQPFDVEISDEGAALVSGAFHWFADRIAQLVARLPARLPRRTVVTSEGEIVLRPASDTPQVVVDPQ